MRKILLPVLGIIFAAPTAMVALQSDGALDSFFAFAEPPALLEGCMDVPEAVALAEELRDRALGIEQYMEALDAKKAEISASEAQIKKQLVHLQALKNGLRARDMNNKTAVETDIDKLVAVYDQMKPAEAAAVLTNLPADFAAEILMRVQPEAGARIIASVEPRQAALLTAQMGARSIQSR